MNEDESFKFKDAERKCSRPGDIVYHEGDLHLSQYKWQFGKTPFYSDDVYNLDPDLEALDSATAAQPNIAGKLKNNMFFLKKVTNVKRKVKHYCRRSSKQQGVQNALKDRLPTNSSSNFSIYSSSVKESGRAIIAVTNDK